MTATQPASLFATTLEGELKSQRLPREELNALQLRRLRTLLTRAAQFVPLYRERMAQHRHWLPQLKQPDDLWRLPTVEKADFLKAGIAGCIDEREDPSRLICRTTSGSLGRALRLFAAPTEAAVLESLFWTGWMWRLTPQDRVCCLAAPSVQFDQQHVPNVFIPVQATSAETVARFREFQPTALLGSVEAIALLARDLRQHQIPERHGVRAIFPFGQTLTPMLRAMICEGFDAEVFDLYGSSETLWAGVECEQHDGLHVPLGRAIVQIAKLNQPDVPAAAGEVGEVIVTSLARWTTPIIRYRIGDVAALDCRPCPCGRPTPRLKSLEGRVQDFLIATSGAWISPGAIQTEVAYGQDAILDLRIVQQTPASVHVSIVPAANFGEPQRRHIAGAVRRQLGPVQVLIELVTEIPREPSGKRRRVHRAF